MGFFFLSVPKLEKKSTPPLIFRESVGASPYPSIISTSSPAGATLEEEDAGIEGAEGGMSIHSSLASFVSVRVGGGSGGSSACASDREVSARSSADGMFAARGYTLERVRETVSRG